MQCTTELRCSVIIVYTVGSLITVIVNILQIITIFKHRKVEFKSLFFKLSALTELWDTVSRACCSTYAEIQNKRTIFSCVLKFDKIPKFINISKTRNSCVYSLFVLFHLTLVGHDGAQFTKRRYLTIYADQYHFYGQNLYHSNCLAILHRLVHISW